MLFSGDLSRFLDRYLCEAAPLGSRISKIWDLLKKLNKWKKRLQGLTLGPLCFGSSVRQKLMFAINPRRICFECFKVAFEMAFIIYLE